VESRHRHLAAPLLTARLILGLIFFMAGVWKVFSLGPLTHASQLFIEPYRETFLPVWSLWLAGTTIPFVELIAGALLLPGLFTRPALAALAAVLVLVTFGHLLRTPLYEFHTHVIPRTALLLFIWSLPAAADRFSVDAWLRNRRLPNA
jgi:putative oxidoreductase